MLDKQKNSCNYPKFGTVLFYYRVMGPKDADRMAIGVDSDQTNPLGSGSSLFAHTCLSDNLGSLWYGECIPKEVQSMIFCTWFFADFVKCKKPDKQKPTWSITLPFFLIGPPDFYHENKGTEPESPKISFCVGIYRRTLKNLDTRKIAVIILKLEHLRVMHPKHAEGIANGADPDQTAPPLGVV